MPYYYLYDSQLQSRAFANQLIKLEHTLTDLGIQGKIGRLTLLKSVDDLVASAIHDGYDTVVAVGNDATFSRVAEALINHPYSTLGFIPLGSGPHTMAQLLGIPVGVLACQVVSSRLVEEIHTGRINNHYFVQSVTAEGAPLLTGLNRRRSFRVQLDSPHRIKICNLDWADAPHRQPSDPRQEALELALEPTRKKHWWAGQAATAPVSLIPVQQLKIDSGGDELPLTVDGHRIVKTPATVSIAPERLRIIVGKKRLIE